MLEDAVSYVKYCRPTGIMTEICRVESFEPGAFCIECMQFRIKPITHKQAQSWYTKTRIIIQFFIIYTPSRQVQGQLQTQHSVDPGNYILEKHNIKTTATQ
jgi:hypothetical protein